MTTPSPIPYSSVPVGGVLTEDLTIFWIKTDSNTNVNLKSGQESPAPTPTTLVTYLANAQLIF